jgi:predicted secreted protein
MLDIWVGLCLTEYIRRNKLMEKFKINVAKRTKERRYRSEEYNYEFYFRIYHEHDHTLNELVADLNAQFPFPYYNITVSKNTAYSEDITSKVLVIKEHYL